MARIIEISEKKRDKMTDHVEDALIAMGKVMQCLEELGGGEMGERNSYNNRQSMGNRDRYGNRTDRGNGESYGNREDWDEDMDDEPMGERRRRNHRTGRFM